MAFDRAKTSLAFLEERFRKLFNLAGTIGASFEPDIKPVVLAGDLDGPGYASFRGRHWACASATIGPNALANDMYVWQTPVDVIVYGVWLAGISASSVAEAYLIEPPAALAALVIAGLNVGCWTDQKAVTADPCPFLDSNSTRIQSVPGTALLTAQRRIAAWASPASGAQGDTMVTFGGGGIHVVAGSQLIWRLAAIAANAVAVTNCGLYGRIF